MYLFVGYLVKINLLAFLGNSGILSILRLKNVSYIRCSHDENVSWFEFVCMKLKVVVLYSCWRRNFVCIFLILRFQTKIQIQENHYVGTEEFSYQISLYQTRIRSWSDKVQRQDCAWPCYGKAIHFGRLKKSDYSKYGKNGTHANSCLSRMELQAEKNRKKAKRKK